MSQETKYTLIFEHYSPTQLQVILAFIRRHEIPSAHYFGEADESLLRVLIAESNFTLSVTDYFDRWGVSAYEVACEEGFGHRVEPPPSWLDRVDFYQEGMAQEVPLFIFDLEPSECRLHRILAEGRRPDRKTCFVMSKQPPFRSPGIDRFRWIKQDALWLGILKNR